jgi:hypothetical protein
MSDAIERLSAAEAAPLARDERGRHHPVTGPEEEERRFRRRVQVAENGCWMWTGAVIHSAGSIYGRFRDELAHRASFRSFKGPIPSGHLVRHTCDTPLCVNPDHLLSGTQADNMRDARERGRTARGESLFWAKLTAQKVRDMRAMRLTGATYPTLGLVFGVSQQTAWDACTGRTWRHV